MKTISVFLGANLVLAWNCFAGTSGDRYWERELRQMGYLFLHISSINVINGLNLTRNQAVKLRRLARKVEAAAPKPPSFKQPLGPEMEKVRADWLAIREVLLSGDEVPEDLKRRVNEGRVRESRIIRAGLRPAPVEQSTSCGACHRAPAGRDPGTVTPMQLGGRTKRLAEIAHMELVYGRRGIVALIQASPEVNRVLTDGQRAILNDFACCLVPPQDLDDPVRAGQAEVSTKAVDLMRRIRRCPDAHWPRMRSAILQRIRDLTSAINPGAGTARRSAAAESVGNTIDRVRTLSDVQFEIEKGELARKFRAALVPPAGEWEHKAAYFLLVPGASKVYTELIRRQTGKTRSNKDSARR